QHVWEVDFSRFDFTLCATIALLAVLYGAANTMLARAWWWQLKIFNIPADWRWALKTYGLSQLAKYVPGNIFHLAGRQALGMAIGLAGRPLAKSAVWELGSIAVAAACFGILAMPLMLPIQS